MQKGFVPIFLLIGIVAAGAIFLIWTVKFRTTPLSPKVTQQFIPTPEPKALESTASAVVAGWQAGRFFIVSDGTFNQKNPTSLYFDISFPQNYSIKISDEDLRIKDEKDNDIITIYNFVSSDAKPTGKTTIDDMQYDINDFKDIECLANLSPTKWRSNNQSLMNIHLDCPNGDQNLLKKYIQIIQSIRFSPELKKEIQ